MVKTKAKKKATNAKARTKTELFNELAGANEMTRKQVGVFFDALSDVVRRDLGRRGPGIFTVPGLLKIKKVSKPAVKARKGINPFTGEETMFKAKPARNVVKIQALKGLKEMV